MSLRRQAASTATLIPRTTNSGFGLTSTGAIGFSEDVEREHHHLFNLAASATGGGGAPETAHGLVMQQQIQKLQKQIETMSLANNKTAEVAQQQESKVMSNRDAFQSISTSAANWPYITSSSSFLETGKLMDASHDMKKQLSKYAKAPFILNEKNLRFYGAKAARIMMMYKVLWDNAPDQMRGRWKNDDMNTGKWNWTDDTTKIEKEDVFDTVLDPKFKKYVAFLKSKKHPKYLECIDDIETHKEKLRRLCLQWGENGIFNFGQGEMMRYVKILKYLKPNVDNMKTLKTKIDNKKKEKGPSAFLPSQKSDTYWSESQQTPTGTENLLITWHDVRNAYHLWKASVEYDALASSAHFIEDEVHSAYVEVSHPHYNKSGKTYQTPDNARMEEDDEQDTGNTANVNGTGQSMFTSSHNDEHSKRHGIIHRIVHKGKHIAKSALHHRKEPEDDVNEESAFCSCEHPIPVKSTFKTAGDFCSCEHPIPVRSTFKTAGDFCSCEHPIPVFTAGQRQSSSYWGSTRAPGGAQAARGKKKRKAQKAKKHGNGKTTINHIHYHGHNTRSRGRHAGGAYGLRRVHGRGTHNEFDVDDSHLFQGDRFDEYYI